MALALWTKSLNFLWPSHQILATLSLYMPLSLIESPQKAPFTRIATTVTAEAEIGVIALNDSQGFCQNIPWKKRCKIMSEIKLANLGEVTR